MGVHNMLALKKTKVEETFLTIVGSVISIEYCFSSRSIPEHFLYTIKFHNKVPYCTVKTDRLWLANTH